MSTAQLYDYQVKARDCLVAALEKYNTALDASDTGTGKTFVALGVAKKMGKVPLIISPKSVISAWKKAAEALDIEVLDVINIEKLKTGKLSYLKCSDGKGARKKWFWNMPRGTMVIVDECHIMSGRTSANSKIMAATKLSGYVVLGLSATVAESPLKMKAMGYLLGLHKYADFNRWCLNNGCYINLWGGIDYSRVQAKSYMQRLHKQIFPEKGNRMKVADLKGFPENKIIAEAFDLSKMDAKKINEIYDKMSEEVKDPSKAVTEMVAQLRARQKVELIKVPLLEELVDAALEEDRSAVVFVSFRETLDELIQKYPDASIVHGGQSQMVRDLMIEQFQSDHRRVCLCTIQSGGLSISLHDLHGNHPRSSFLTPTFNAVDLKQALGRIPRAGGKSKCIQTIVFAAGTVEEKVCKSVKRKLDQISMLNDGDLSLDIPTVRK